jgi:hypothetical protein
MRLCAILLPLSIRIMPQHRGCSLGSSIRYMGKNIRDPISNSSGWRKGTKKSPWHIVTLNAIPQQRGHSWGFSLDIWARIIALPNIKAISNSLKLGWGGRPWNRLWDIAWIWWDLENVKMGQRRSKSITAPSKIWDGERLKPSDQFEVLQTYEWFRNKDFEHNGH